MGCRGAIHCAHLGSRGIPQGAMNCAPTPCAYLKGIDRKGHPYSTTDQPAKAVESSGVARGTLGSTLQLVHMGDRKGSPLLYHESAWQARVTCGLNRTIRSIHMRLPYTS